MLQRGCVFFKNTGRKKRVDFAKNAVEVAIFAYKRRCCIKNCILDLVE